MDLRRLRKLRELPQEAREHPVAVHGRMPVEAAVERWMKRAGREHLVRAVHHVLELVWIFLARALEREPGKMRCGACVERQRNREEVYHLRSLLRAQRDDAPRTPRKWRRGTLPSTAGKSCGHPRVGVDRTPHAAFDRDRRTAKRRQEHLV